jgi:hypothetical protein
MTDKLSVAIAAGIAVAGVLLIGSSHTSATPASGPAIIHAAKQTDAVITVRRRCYPGYYRDRYGYCVPSARGF